jgi:activator of HSP90 ATPase
MAYEFVVSDVIPGSPQAIYDAWLSTEGHTAMTGGEAHVDPTIGGAFDAWDGYISGRTLSLDPGRQIVQTWRTTEFTEGDEDSQIAVNLEAADGGTNVTLVHSNVPDGHRSYEEGGWQSNYFDPMKAYFAPR